MSIHYMLLDLRDNSFYMIDDEPGSDPALVVFTDAWLGWYFLELLQDERGDCEWELVPAKFTAPNSSVRICLNPEHRRVGHYMSGKELVEQM